VAISSIGIPSVPVVAVTSIITPIPIVAITGIVITPIPVVAIRREPIPVIIGWTTIPIPVPVRSGKKSAVITTKDRPGDKRALTAKDPSGDKPALAAKVPARKWDTHIHDNSASPAIPALRNSVRWFHDCQRGHRSEKCDALQHNSLLYRSAPPYLT